MQPVVRTSFSALAVGGLMAGLFDLAVIRQVTPFEARFDTVDGKVLGAVVGAVAFLVPFVAAHMAARAAGLGRSVVYSAAGAIALLVSFLASGGLHVIDLAAANDMVTVAFIGPAAMGGVFGYLYHHRAGYSGQGDDPAKLAARIGATRSQADPLATGEKPAFGHAPHSRAGVASSADFGSAAPKAGPDLVDVDGTSYFSGPLQVRTSIPLMLIAGLCAGAALAATRLLFSLMPVMFDFGYGSLLPKLGGRSTYGLVDVLASGLAGAILFPIPIYICHMFARSRRWTSLAAYAGAGALLPIALGLAIFLIGVVVTVMFVPPMALAMLLYRRLAGLEPLALPNDITVRDPRTLIGEDHVRRSYNRVVRR